MTSMIILVCGSRHWTNREMIETVLSSFAKGDTIIHGACRGADIIAGEIAEKFGLNVSRFPAQWDKHGRAAGPIRNQEMLDIGRPDIIVAFHNQIETSKGTKDMINRAKKANVPYLVLKEE